MEAVRTHLLEVMDAADRRQSQRPSRCAGNVSREGIQKRVRHFKVQVKVADVHLEFDERGGTIREITRRYELRFGIGTVASVQEIRQ